MTKAKETYSLSYESRVYLFRALGVMMKAGLQPGRIFHLFEEPSNPEDLRDFAKQVYQLIGVEGHSFGTAFAKFPRYFSAHQRTAISVGEQSGDISKTFITLADEDEKQWALRAKLKSKLGYPIFLFLLCAIGYGLLIPYFVFPQYLKLVEMVEVEPGSVFDWVLKLIRFTQTPVLKIGILFGIALLSLLSSSAMPRYILIKSISKLLGSLPFASPIFRSISKSENPPKAAKIEMVRLAELVCWMGGPLMPLKKLLQAIWITNFSRALSVQIQASITLQNSLALAIEATGSEILSQKSKQITSTVAAGETLSNSLKISGWFPDAFIQWIVIGEEGGALTENLDRATRIYADYIDETLDVGMSALEPIMMGFSGMVVGCSVLMMIFPIVKVVQQL